MVLGVAIPALLVWLVTLAGSMLGYLGISIAFLGSLLCWGGAMFWYVHARRKSPYLYVQIARKVAIGWLVVAGLAVAGLLTTCLFSTR